MTKRWYLSIRTYILSLGFKPELVQMPCLKHTEIHALLWHGFIADTPIDLEAKFDELATRINADAIRYATGGWVTSTQ